MSLAIPATFIAKGGVSFADGANDTPDFAKSGIPTPFLISEALKVSKLFFICEFQPLKFSFVVPRFNYVNPSFYSFPFGIRGKF